MTKSPASGLKFDSFFDILLLYCQFAFPARQQLLAIVSSIGEIWQNSINVLFKMMEPLYQNAQIYFFLVLLLTYIGRVVVVLFAHVKNYYNPLPCGLDSLTFAFILARTDVNWSIE